tara:strand:- start:21 stop:425 length:405 start_codon:yes stop_codon:yes gene_type:complete
MSGVGDSDISRKPEPCFKLLDLPEDPLIAEHFVESYTGREVRIMDCEQGEVRGVLGRTNNNLPLGRASNPLTYSLTTEDSKRLKLYHHNIQTFEVSMAVTTPRRDEQDQFKYTLDMVTVCLNESPSTTRSEETS